MLIRLVHYNGKKIAAIKEFRNLFCAGLREAKDAVDSMIDFGTDIDGAALGVRLPSRKEVDDSEYFRVVSAGAVTLEDLKSDIRKMVTDTIDMKEFGAATALIDALKELG